MARGLLMILLATAVNSHLLHHPLDSHHEGDALDVDTKHDQAVVLSRHRRSKTSLTNKPHLAFDLSGYGLTSEGFATVGGLLLGVLTYISLPPTRRRQGRQFSNIPRWRQGGRCIYKLGRRCVYGVRN